MTKHLSDHYIKINDHYNSTIINIQKNSGISTEAQIIIIELLSNAKNSTKNISKILLEMIIKRMTTLIYLLSNHTKLPINNNEFSI